MIKLLFVLALAWGVWMMVRPKRKRPPLIAGEGEARAVLGVGADADEHAIRDAHRRLIERNHPDKGGSADLARRINAARDVLLRKS